MPYHTSLHTGLAAVISLGQITEAKDYIQDFQLWQNDRVKIPITITTADQDSCCPKRPPTRSEEHTSELQPLMRISYAVFCLKKKIIQLHLQIINNIQNT